MCGPLTDKKANGTGLCIGLFFFATLITGCSTLRQAIIERSLQNDWYQLQPAVALGYSLSATQFVVIRHDARVFSSLNRVEWNSDKMTLAAFSHMGGPLFTVVYQNEEMQADYSPGVPPEFHAGYVLKDYQLCFLPIAEVRKGLRNQRVRIDEHQGGREFYHNEELLLEIRYENQNPWLGKVALINHQHGYSLEIKTVEFN